MNEHDDQVRVLVVDDVADACIALAMQLELDGYRTMHATDATTALEMVGQFKPHCVLLDIHMPGIDGLQLSRLLRRHYHDDIVLIAVTGRGPGETRVADTFAVVDYYLQKPVDLAKLRKILPSLTP